MTKSQDIGVIASEHLDAATQAHQELTTNQEALKQAFIKQFTTMVNSKEKELSQAKRTFLMENLEQIFNVYYKQLNDTFIGDSKSALAVALSDEKKRNELARKMSRAIIGTIIQANNDTLTPELFKESSPIMDGSIKAINADIDSVVSIIDAYREQVKHILMEGKSEADFKWPYESYMNRDMTTGEAFENYIVGKIQGAFNEHMEAKRQTNLKAKSKTVEAQLQAQQQGFEKTVPATVNHEISTLLYAKLRQASLDKVQAQKYMVTFSNLFVTMMNQLVQMEEKPFYNEKSNSVHKGVIGAIARLATELALNPHIMDMDPQHQKDFAQYLLKNAIPQMKESSKVGTDKKGAPIYEFPNEDKFAEHNAKKEDFFNILHKKALVEVAPAQSRPQSIISSHAPGISLNEFKAIQAIKSVLTEYQPLFEKINPTYPIHNVLNMIIRSPSQSTFQEFNAKISSLLSGIQVGLDKGAIEVHEEMMKKIIQTYRDHKFEVGFASEGNELSKIVKVGVKTDRKEEEDVRSTLTRKK